MRAGVIIPYRKGCPWRDRSLPVVQRWWETICPDWPVSVADDGGTPFSRGGSLNLGVEYSGVDVIVAADSDLLIGHTQIRRAVELAAETAGLVQPFDRLDRYSENATRRLWEAPWRAFDGTFTPMTSWGRNVVPLVGGINVLSRETWELAGGWLPGFRGWGHEDVAFEAQCSTLAGPTRHVAGTVAHLAHPIAARDRDQANNDLAVRVMAATGDPEAMRKVIADG